MVRRKYTDDQIKHIASSLTSIFSPSRLDYNLATRSMNKEEKRYLNMWIERYEFRLERDLADINAND